MSAHVAGRRLAEILEVAARADLRPSTAGVMAVTRQLMASVALLHDFAPYGFHGALGPDRLILAGEGRVVVAEHVLGSLVEEAAAAWGATRLWQDFRIAALAEPKSAQWGRRVDIVQVGLITLAMLRGRTIDTSEYPAALPQLLGQVEETTPDGTHVALRSPLRGWLERTLSIRPDSFRTLLEAQKAFAQLLSDEGYHASSVAWDAFVGVCETAALRVPVVVVVPETAPAPEPRDTVTTPAAAPIADSPKDGVDQAVPVILSVDAEPSPEPTQNAGDVFVAADRGAPDAPASVAPNDSDPVAQLREDPFGPWPVTTPTGSTASLLDSFDVPPAPLMGAAALAAAPSESERPPHDPWAAAPPAPPEPPKPEPRSETLFEAPTPRPTEAPAPPPPVPETPWQEPKASPPTSVADWRTRDRERDLSYQILNEGQRPLEQDAEPEPEEASGWTRKRRVRVAVLVVLVLFATAAAAFAPYLWKVVYEGRLVQGTLRVSSEPAGAVISVDGQVRGHTPADLSVKAGEHLLELQVGGSAKSKKVTIEANTTVVETMTFPEAGERGGLMISTYPSKGKITVDGIPRGNAPLKVTDLQPGTHTLLVQTSFGSQEQDVVVQSGRVSQLAVPTVSWLKVTAPYELTVYEDGRLVGTASGAPVMIAPGRRNLDFVNKALGLKLRQFVDAVAGQIVTVPLDLPTGMMNLYSDQPAEVLVDGTVVGQTPLPNLQVPLGSHDVVFRHQKYGEVRYAVAVTLTAPVKLTVTFRK